MYKNTILVLQNYNRELKLLSMVNLSSRMHKNMLHGFYFSPWGGRGVSPGPSPFPGRRGRDIPQPSGLAVCQPPPGRYPIGFLVGSVRQSCLLTYQLIQLVITDASAQQQARVVLHNQIVEAMIALQGLQNFQRHLLKIFINWSLNKTWSQQNTILTKLLLDWMI